VKTVNGGKESKRALLDWGHERWEREKKLSNQDGHVDKPPKKGQLRIHKRALTKTEWEKEI